MSVSTTLPDITLSASDVGRTAGAQSVALGRGLLARCGAWLRHRNDAARLRDMEPHLARDMGVAPVCDGCPEGFAADPRPLWGIGLTPLPTSVSPPWSGDRRR
jgi:hypothetical protein